MPLMVNLRPLETPKRLFLISGAWKSQKGVISGPYSQKVREILYVIMCHTLAYLPPHTLNLCDIINERPLAPLVLSYHQIKIFRGWFGALNSATFIPICQDLMHIFQNQVLCWIREIELVILNIMNPTNFVSPYEGVLIFSANWCGF